MSAGITRKVGFTRRYFGWLCIGFFATCFMAVVLIGATCRADGAMHQCRVLEDYLKDNPAHLFEFKCKDGTQQTINEEGVLNHFIATEGKIRWASNTHTEILIDDYEVLPKDKVQFLKEFMLLHTQPKEQEFKTQLWNLVKEKLRDCIHKASHDPKRGCNVLQLEFKEEKQEPESPGQAGTWHLHIHIISGERTSPVLIQETGPARFASFQRIRNSAITEDVTKRCMYTNMGLGTANLILFLSTGIMMWVTKLWLEIRCGNLDVKRTQWEVRDSIESQDDFFSTADHPPQCQQGDEVFQPGHWGTVFDPLEEAQKASLGKSEPLAENQCRHQSSGHSSSIPGRSWMSLVMGNSSSN